MTIPSTISAVQRGRGRRTVSRNTTSNLSASTPVRFLRPIAAPITDGFGWRGNRPHHGIDFPAGSGAPVTAGGVGVVHSAGYNAFGYGNLVVVSHRPRTFTADEIGVVEGLAEKYRAKADQVDRFLKERTGDGSNHPGRRESEREPRRRRPERPVGLELAGAVRAPRQMTAQRERHRRGRQETTGRPGGRAAACRLRTGP